MRPMFTVILLLLVGLSLATWWSIPEKQSDKPILYWVTDLHPGRPEQINTFHKWLEKNGYPDMEMRLDAANNDVSKKLIQGVSGVAGEILDVYRGKQEMLYLYQAGILKDMTEPAKELGFDASHTWEAIAPDLLIDGRQYGFPRNVAVLMYWVNEDTFARYGMAPPPHSWTWDDFERIGREFVEKANRDNPSPRRFFALPDYFNPNVLPTIMLRGAGLDVFNETLTACVLDDPRFAMVLEKIHQWTYADRLIPSSADQASFSGSAGFGGAVLHLFNEGSFGMIMMGRYALLQLRQFEPIPLDVVAPPYRDYPNTIIFAGMPTVFREAPHADLAKYFLSYMASEDYNMLIVRDGDALPPNPVYTRTEAFLRPPDHPNEWGCHEAFTEAADSIAITYSNSPFVLPVSVSRLFQRYYDLFMNNRISAGEAGRRLAEEINRELVENLKDRPVLRARYAEKRILQEKIDSLKAAGKPIPREWIENPFHLKYYADNGLLE
jgi:multiple sugar transport system substrate-binding protein